MKLDSKILYYEESGGEYFYNKIFNKFAIFDTNKFSELKLERLFNKNIKGLVEHLDFVLKKITYIDNSLENVSHSSFIKEYFEKQIKHKLSLHKNNDCFEFVDLFCGAGGLSSGLELSKLNPVMALDKDSSALLTYSFNRPFLRSDQILNQDIKLIASDYIFDKIPLVVGGPPCQGFSTANQQKSDDDERNYLYKFFIHAVKASSADVFLMENVEGILTFINQIKADFEDIGFDSMYVVLNTRDFGFPQNRKRVFILGINRRLKSILPDLQYVFKTTIASHMQSKIYSLIDAIGDLPVLDAKTLKNSTYTESAKWGYTFGREREFSSSYSKLINNNSILTCPLLNHKSKFNNARDINIYGLLNPGEGSESCSLHGVNPYINRNHIFKDKFYKLLPHEPSKTITAHMYYDCHMYIHPYQARGLTPREAARIQGFPDDYLFLGSPNEWYRQIGNAVSPLMARVIGKALYNVLSRIYAN